MVEEGEDVSAFESFSAEDAGGAAPKASPKEDTSKADAEPESAPAAAKEDASSIQAQESDSTGGKLETALERAPKISPAAQKLALEKGVALGSIKGSVPGGRIELKDIEQFKPAASGGAGAVSAGPTYEDIPATNM